MNELKKLSLKMDKRIGMRAVTKDNMKAGTITGYNLEDLNNVKYLICYDGKDKILRQVDESNVVILLKEM